MLDHVVVTHYHGDHVGGVAELAEKVPIRHFYDHGPYTVELQPNRRTGFVSYKAIRDLAHVTVPRVGDTVPLGRAGRAVRDRVGTLLKTALSGAPGAGASNAYCRDATLKAPDPTPENQEVLGMVIRFGEFRLLNLADLTWNQEHQIICPNNLLGTFDVFHTTRHGDTNSGAPQLIYAIKPRVAIMNNGERKGGAPGTGRPCARRRGSRTSGSCTARKRAARRTIHPIRSWRTSTKRTTGTTCTCPCAPTAASRSRNSRTGFKKDYAARR